MSDSNDKGALIEKLVFAAIPILFTCIVYLFTTLNTAQYNLREVEKQAALARAEMQLGFQKAIDEAAISRAAMTTEIELLKEKLKALEVCQ